MFKLSLLLDTLMVFMKEHFVKTQFETKMQTSTIMKHNSTCKECITATKKDEKDLAINLLKPYLSS